MAEPFTDSTNYEDRSINPVPQRKPKQSLAEIEAQRVKNKEMQEDIQEKCQHLMTMVEDLANKYSKYVFVHILQFKNKEKERTTDFIARQLLLSEIGEEQLGPSVWWALLHHEAKACRLEGRCK